VDGWVDYTLAGTVAWRGAACSQELGGAPGVVGRFQPRSSQVG